MMRLALLVAAAAAACTRAAPDDALGLHDPTTGSAPECAADADCVAAASTCCECPSFALPASSGWQSACDAIMCPTAPSCSEVRAACVDGACALACNAIACDQSCADGFAVDAAGCQVCACATPTTGNSSQCTADDQCAEVRADCCGCAQGGADTAVPAADAAAHDASLMCPAQPACPGVDVCTPGAAPRCDHGTCVLAATSPTASLPMGACGRPDLPACPSGLRCVLNASAEAGAAGVGVCAP